MHDRLITRRRVLAGFAAVALGGLTGCTDGTSEPDPGRPAPHPVRDPFTARLLISSKAALLDRYAVALAQRPTPAGLAPFVRRHEQHIDAVRALVAAAATPTATPTATTPPGDQPVAVGELTAAESAAGRGRTLLVAAAESSRLATLIAAIGACESAHGVLLGAPVEPRSPAPWPTTAADREIEALQTALAAEHAAIYGYGLVGAYLSGGSRDAAVAAHDDHRLHRNQLTLLIDGSGAQPEVAAPAYSLPFAVRDPATARRLAAVLEEGIASSYAGVVDAARSAALRMAGARTLTAAAVRRTQWGGGLSAFPGLVEPSA